MKTTEIRKFIHNKKNVYSAQDVFTSIGLPWSSKKSLKDLKQGQHFKKVKVGNVNANKVVSRTEMYVLTEPGVTKITSLHKKASPIPAVTITTNAAPQKTANEVESLKAELNKVKLLLANITFNKAALPNTGAEFKLDKTLSPKDQIKAIVSNHAERQAAALGITDKADFGVFYEMSYAILYQRYKQLNNLDANNTGIPGSKLAAVDQLGHINGLLTLAKKLFT